MELRGVVETGHRYISTLYKYTVNMHEVFQERCVSKERANPPDQVQKLSVEVDGFSENILHCDSVLSFYFLMLEATLREHILEFAGYSIRLNAMGWVVEHKCCRMGGRYSAVRAKLYLRKDMQMIIRLLYIQYTYRLSRLFKAVVNGEYIFRRR